MMRGVTIAAAAALTLIGLPAHGAERTRAAIACAATERPLVYECTIRLTDARTGAPLAGAEFTVGTDMPSMPMAHHLHPAPAKAAEPPGTYLCRVSLEMHGEWALRLRLSKPYADMVVALMRFEPGTATPKPR